MVHLIGISGSLRGGSYNTALLRAAQTLAGEGVTLEVATLHGIPLYDGDLEQREGIPAAVESLKERIAHSDGLLLATPEYNNGLPGVFKNAIDWLSRPPKDIARVFSQRPVAVMGASLGNFGTILAQNDWLPVLRALGARQWAGGRLMVSKAQQLFDESGELADPTTREHLRDFMQDFVRDIRAQPKNQSSPR